VIDLQPSANPIPVLMSYFKSEPGDECVVQLQNLATKQQWSETALIKYIFASLFPDADMKTDFYKKARYLSYFSTNDKQLKVVLYCIEKHMGDNKKCIDLLPNVLNGFYDECVLDEERIVKWYQNPNKKADQKLSKDMRDKAKIFVDWLKTAEVVD